MSVLRADRFAEFFEALHGKKPFPWQVRLAEQVIGADRTEQAWPERIALPTASGKTACIDVAVFALACQAALTDGGRGRRAPRRIFYVVDRRIIVDQAFLHASETVAGRLANPDCEILRVVAASLQDLARSPHENAVAPLLCYQLRGGMYRDNAWARSPSQPLVVCGTVDQIGSRLLFRGYGVSDKSKPLHAGLIANDSLIILDEAHCAVPFEQTIQAVRRYRGSRWAQCPLESPFSLTLMSATQRNDRVEPFTLRDADYKNETLGTRLRASKPARLIEVKAKTATAAFAQSLVQQAFALAERGARRIAILVNRVDTAKLVFQRLKVPDERKALFIGRMRPLDGQRLINLWKDRLTADDERGTLDQAVFVAATQCLEVGANFDFDGMVSECASLDALQQRFGRLNRLGNGHAQAVIAISTDDAKGKQADPIYGTALASTWDWLSTQARNTDASSAPEIDMGVNATSNALAATPDEAKEKLFRRGPDAPVMLPSHIDCWVQTSPRPEPDPDVSLFLHGQTTTAPEVRVCWRADLDFEPDDPRQPTKRQQAQWIEALALCPPASGECMAVPLHLFRAWMRGESVDSKALADIEGANAFDDSRDSSDGAAAVVRWYGPSDDETAVVTSPSDVRPGDTIVIPAMLKGWENFGYIPGLARDEPATDLGDEAGFVARGRRILRIHPDVVASWSTGAAEAAAEQIAMSAARLVKLSQSDDLIEALEGAEETDWLDEFRQELSRLSSIPEIPTWLRAAAMLGDNPRLEELLRLHPCGWPATVPEFEALDEPEQRDGRPLREGDETDGRVSRPRADVLSSGGLVLLGPNERYEQQQADPFTHEDDSSSSTTRVPLREHLEGVAQLARHYSAACGMSNDFQHALELAGLLHDIGKLDERFQAWLHGGNRALAFVASEPLAKSSLLTDYRTREAARRKSGYPRGGRHELLSLQMAASADEEILRDAADPDLVLHLIGSHHGNCRPFAPYVYDERAPAVHWEHRGVTRSLSEADRADWKAHALDSGIADRFWRLVRRYGWWGLAWIEAVFVLADRSRSRHEAQEDMESRHELAVSLEVNG